MRIDKCDKYLRKTPMVSSNINQYIKNSYEIQQKHLYSNVNFVNENENENYKKLSYCWETVRRESMPRIAEMDVEMTT